MKRLTILSVLLLLTLSANAGSPYFSTREGERMYYVRRNASNGKLVWTYTATVDKVYEGGIDFTYDFHRPGGGQMYGGPLKLNMEVNDAGDIMVDVAATVKTFVHNIFPKVDIRSEGGRTDLPSDMKPGDVLPDVTANAKVMGMNYLMTYSGRKVLRGEVLTVPAGTYDCIVVEEHKTEVGLGRNRDVMTLTWYAKGTGVVKHESYDWNTGKLLTVETLETVE